MKLSNRWNRLERLTAKSVNNVKKVELINYGLILLNEEDQQKMRSILISFSLVIYLIPS